MLFCAAGDIHGAIDRMYDDVLAFETSLGKRFDWVLHVGDFGIWPDPNRIDRATRTHDGAGDFPAWLANQRAAPRNTVFIKGNHEDFLWLDAQPRPEVLPGLFYLRNGHTMNLGGSGDPVRVGGVGGCYSPSDFERLSKRLQGYAKRHYTRDEIETLCTVAGTDILLVHDAPLGVRFETHRQGHGWTSEAAGLDELIRRLRPLVCFFGHHHTRVDSEIAGIRCVGLNKVGKPAIWSRSISSRGGVSGRCWVNGRFAVSSRIWCVQGAWRVRRGIEGPPSSCQGPIPLFLQRPADPPPGPELELALANTMRELDARQSYGGGPIGLEAQHGPAPALDRPVILLDDVVQVLRISHQDVLPAPVLATRRRSNRPRYI